MSSKSIVLFLLVTGLILGFAGLASANTGNTEVGASAGPGVPYGRFYADQFSERPVTTFKLTQSVDTDILKKVVVTVPASSPDGDVDATKISVRLWYDRDGNSVISYGDSAVSGWVAVAAGAAVIDSSTFVAPYNTAGSHFTLSAGNAYNFIVSAKTTADITAADDTQALYISATTDIVIFDSAGSGVINPVDINSDLVTTRSYFNVDEGGAPTTVMALGQYTPGGVNEGGPQRWVQGDGTSAILQLKLTESGNVVDDQLTGLSVYFASTGSNPLTYAAVSEVGVWLDIGMVGRLDSNDIRLKHTGTHKLAAATQAFTFAGGARVPKNGTVNLFIAYTFSGQSASAATGPFVSAAGQTALGGNSGAASIPGVANGNSLLLDLGAPTLQAVETLDNNEDGYLNGLKLYFSKAIDDAFITYSHNTGVGTAVNSVFEVKVGGTDLSGAETLNPIYTLDADSDDDVVADNDVAYDSLIVISGFGATEAGEWITPTIKLLLQNRVRDLAGRPLALTGLDPVAAAAPSTDKASPGDFTVGFNSTSLDLAADGNVTGVIGDQVEVKAIPPNTGYAGTYTVKGLFNNKELNFAKISGALYKATYSITEGDPDENSTNDHTGVYFITLADPAGNVSDPVNVDWDANDGAAGALDTEDFGATAEIAKLYAHSPRIDSVRVVASRDTLGINESPTILVYAGARPAQIGPVVPNPANSSTYRKRIKSTGTYTGVIPGVRGTDIKGVVTVTTAGSPGATTPVLSTQWQWYNSLTTTWVNYGAAVTTNAYTQTTLSDGSTAYRGSIGYGVDLILEAGNSLSAADAYTVKVDNSLPASEYAALLPATSSGSFTFNGTAYTGLAFASTNQFYQTITITEGDPDNLTAMATNVKLIEEPGSDTVQDQMTTHSSLVKQSINSILVDANRPEGPAGTWSAAANHSYIGGAATITFSASPSDTTGSTEGLSYKIYRATEAITAVNIASLTPVVTNIAAAGSTSYSVGYTLPVAQQGTYYYAVIAIDRARNEDTKYFGGLSNLEDNVAPTALAAGTATYRWQRSRPAAAMIDSTVIEWNDIADIATENIFYGVYRREVNAVTDAWIDSLIAGQVSDGGQIAMCKDSTSSSGSGWNIVFTAPNSYRLAYKSPAGTEASVSYGIVSVDSIYHNIAVPFVPAAVSEDNNPPSLATSLSLTYYDADDTTSTAHPDSTLIMWTRPDTTYTSAMVSIFRVGFFAPTAAWIDTTNFYGHPAIDPDSMGYGRIVTHGTSTAGRFLNDSTFVYDVPNTASSGTYNYAIVYSDSIPTANNVDALRATFVADPDSGKYFGHYGNFNTTTLVTGSLSETNLLVNNATNFMVVYLNETTATGRDTLIFTWTDETIALNESYNLYVSGSLIDDSSDLAGAWKLTGGVPVGDSLETYRWFINGDSLAAYSISLEDTAFFAITSSIGVGENDEILPGINAQLYADGLLIDVQNPGMPSVAFYSAVDNATINTANVTRVKVYGTAEIAEQESISVLTTVNVALVDVNGDSVFATTTANTKTGDYVASVDATALADGPVDATARAQDSYFNWGSWTTMMATAIKDAGAIDAPDALTAADWDGANGLGDNGGFVLLTFDVSMNHPNVNQSDYNTVLSYEIQRQVVLDGTDTWIPWGDVPAYGSVTDTMNVVVATNDTAWTAWRVAASTVEATSSNTASAKGDGVIFANVNPVYEAAKAGEAPVSDFSPVAYGAAIDNIAPASPTELRAVDNPGAGNPGVLLSWTPSVDDDVIGSINIFGVDRPIYGVEGYEIYRKAGDADFVKVGTSFRGDASYVDPVGFGPTEYTYMIRAFDYSPDNEAYSGTNMALAANNLRVGDFTSDDYVNISDFALFGDNYLRDSTNPEWDSLYDLDGVGNVVNISDFAIFGDNYLTGTPPAGKLAEMLNAGVNTGVAMALTGTRSEAAGSGADYVVDVSLQNISELRGFDFVMQYDPEKVEFLSIEGLGEELNIVRGDKPGELLVAKVFMEDDVFDGNIRLSFNSTGKAGDSVMRLISGNLADGGFMSNMVDEAKLGVFRVEALPTVFALEQNFPNPFNPTTTIKYSIPKAAHVELLIINLSGQVVRTLVNNDQRADFYSVVWDGRNNRGEEVGSGMYFYRIQADKFTDINKMMLIK